MYMLNGMLDVVCWMCMLDVYVNKIVAQHLGEIFKVCIQLTVQKKLKEAF